MQRRTSATICGALTSLALTGLTVLPATPASAVAPADGQVFINEIHYDNTGTDTGEAVEIAGPAGTDLTGWSIVLYNGSGGGPYSTIDLAVTLGDQQGGLGTTWVTYPSNGIQNGAPDGLALVNAANEVVQFLSYEGSFTGEWGPAEDMVSTAIGVSESGSEPAGQSLQLTGSGTTYGDFTWAPASGSTFGTTNMGQTFGDGTPGADPAPRPQMAPCAIPPTHEIGEVQGSGDSTPLAGTVVTVEGVVVGDFQASGQLGGFFMQDADGDVLTSDGIFVYAPNAPAVDTGDLVRVTGRPSEYWSSGSELSSTQISAYNLVGDCGTGELPEPSTLTLPASDEQRERLEHMLVTVSQKLVATESYTLGQYGELWVSLDERLEQPTNNGGTDAENIAEQAANDARRLLIDDGSSRSNPWNVPFTDDEGPIRLGDEVTGVTGVLDSAHDAYRIQPTTDPGFTRVNPRPEAPDSVGGDLQVASFNVLNYFTTIDDNGGPGSEDDVKTDAGHDPRGADTEEEFVRQRAKIVTALLKLDADVVGLMEIENDFDDEAVDNLVSALNARAGEQTYAAVEEPDTAGNGLFGTDAIKVAMIYKPAVVRPLDRSYTTQDDAFDNARLPLAQRFIPVAGGAPFTAVVNHFKSKGCSGATGLNADQGDGQGCWNADRVEQAHALLDFIGTLDGEDFMIIGDLNSYGEEDPIDVLEEAGYIDQIDAGLAPEDQYSYVFSGQFGYLDHALVSPHLARRVTGVDIWHINSDEARALDYNDYNQDDLYSPDEYKSSDHDPVLVGLSAQPPRRSTQR